MAKFNKRIAELKNISLEEDNFMKIIKIFISEENKLITIENLKEGYEEMGKINLVFAEIGLSQDLIDLSIYEARLTGRDIK